MMKSVLPLTREDIVGNSAYTPSQASLPSFPQAQSNKGHHFNLTNVTGSKYKIPYLKRLKNFQSLDFETALWEMINLVIRPKRVYKSLYYQTQTKNKWSREDPSFILILTFFLIVSAVFWGLVYTSGVFGILKLIVYMVIVDFWVVGCIISTLGWIIARKFMMIESNNNNGNLLEWTYCFDIHCNAYLIIWITLYLVQFFVLPILRMNNWISLILGNSLYLMALSYYSLITFYGYNALPFLHKTEFLLLPILGFALIFVIFTITGFNMANYLTGLYFN